MILRMDRAAQANLSPEQTALWQRMVMNMSLREPLESLNQRFADFKDRLATTRSKYPHLSDG